MKIYLDIGAHLGSETDKFANIKDSFVYSFEPNPDLYTKLLNKNKPNVKVLNLAVSNYVGINKFYISNTENPGCSSLNVFSPKSQEKWPGRTDFILEREIDINVIRLDNFIEENKINEIEFIKIDAQGEDLRILEGVGKYLDIIKSGVLESGNEENILYYYQNTTAESIKFLTENGFIIDKIENNDWYYNESNIFFHNMNI